VVPQWCEGKEGSGYPKGIRVVNSSNNSRISSPCKEEVQDQAVRAAATPTPHLNHNMGSSSSSTDISGRHQHLCQPLHWVAATQQSSRGHEEEEMGSKGGEGGMRMERILTLAVQRGSGCMRGTLMPVTAAVKKMMRMIMTLTAAMSRGRKEMWIRQGAHKQRPCILMEQKQQGNRVQKRVQQAMLDTSSE
jgi:hypothetical protein